MSTLNNDVYFLCGMESFKELIGLIEHIDLPLRVRYQFCMAPVSVKSIFLSTLFTKVFTNQQHISLLFTFDKLMICFHLLICCYRGTVSCVSHIAHKPFAFCCQRWNCLHLFFPKTLDTYSKLLYWSLPEATATEPPLTASGSCCRPTTPGPSQRPSNLWPN